MKSLPHKITNKLKIRFTEIKLVLQMRVQLHQN